MLLYANLLGEDWTGLDDAVRRFHSPDPVIRAAGAFRVRRGRGLPARLLACLARLPAEGESIEVRLMVTAGPAGEEWRRTFAGRPLVSAQYARPDGLLAERIGPIEIRFRLDPAGGALLYRTEGAVLRAGPLAVPLPPWLCPRATASEAQAGDPDRITVRVEVALPLLGRLIEYGGDLRVAGGGSPAQGSGAAGANREPSD